MSRVGEQAVIITVLVRHYVSNFAPLLLNLIALRLSGASTMRSMRWPKAKRKGQGDRESSVATQRTALEFSPNRPTDCPNFCALSVTDEVKSSMLAGEAWWAVEDSNL